MPRFARRRSVSRPKRKTKWCSATVNGGIPRKTLLAIGDGVPLCTTTTAVIDQADVVVGGVRGQISITKVKHDDDNPVVAWAIVLGRTGGSADVNPIQVFDPFDTNDLERQDILGMGMCNLPQGILTSADVMISSQEAMVTDVHVKTSRKLLRNWNNLFFWIVSDAGATAGSDDAYRVQASFRTIMKFG